MDHTSKAGGSQTRLYEPSGPVHRPENRRRNSLRRPEFDYTSAAVYFVTICTYERRSLLGEITNEEFRPAAPGVIARECWFKLPYHYERLQLGAFTLMPNHIHAVLSLAAKTEPRSIGLSDIVRAFKAFSARRINENSGTRGKPVWQRGFYDRIVRNATELDRIHKYMADNAAQWQFDRENPARRACANLTPSVGAGLRPAREPIREECIRTDGGRNG